MAVNTAEKRKCISGIPFFLVGPGVTPRAAEDIEWRQQVGYGYSGIRAGATAGIAMRSFVVGSG